MKFSHSSFMSLAPSITIAFLAFWGMYIFPMHWGANVMGADSLSYVTAAREFISGRGFFVIDGRGGFQPLIIWPPGFPILIALFSAVFGGDEAVRILNSFLFAANTFIVGYLLRTCGGGARFSWLPIMGSTVFIASVPVLKIHAEAMSEPLFVSCLLMTFLFMVKYLDSNRRVFLILSSLFCGWGVLTRYIGVTLCMAGVVLITKHRRSDLKNLAVDLLLFGSVSILPLSLWMFRNFIQKPENPISREFAWHPPDYQQWIVLKEGFESWFIPSSFPEGLKAFVGFLALGSIILVLISWKLRSKSIEVIHQNKKTSILIDFIVIFSFFYALFFVFSMSFVDIALSPTPRLMSPIALSVMLVLMFAIVDLYAAISSYFIRVISLVLVFCFLGIGAARAVVWAYAAQRDGLGGYNSPERLNSQVIDYMKGNADVSFSKIVTNDSGKIYFYLSKSTIELPPIGYSFYKFIPEGSKAGEMLPDFESSWNKFNKLIERGALLVYFHKPMQSAEHFFPSENELKKMLKLTLLHSFSDGNIYRID